MSHFIINGKPAGYFEKVMREHAERCAEAIEAGIITPEEAEKLKRDVLRPEQNGAGNG